MFKYLIVDDEKSHRDGFSKLLNIFFPEDIVLEAEDGIEAIKIIEVIGCDIIFTDIKMPHMSGLELLKKIKEKFPAISVVMISGYDEFEYAQTAIKYGAADYLLKPVSPDEVHSITTKIQEKINREKNDIQTQRTIKNHLQETEPIYIEYLANQVFTNPMFLEKDKLKNILPIARKGSFIICEIVNKTKENLPPIAVDKFRIYIKELLNPFSSYSFQLKSYVQYGIILLSDSIKNNSYFENISNKLSLAFPNFNFFLYISAPQSNIFESAYESYREASEMMKYKYYSIGKVYLYEEYKGKINQNIPDISDKVSIVINLLNNNNAIEAYSLIAHTLNISQECLYDPGKLQDSLTFFMLQVFHEITKSLSTNVKQKVENELQMIDKSESYFEISNKIKKILSDIGNDIGFQKHTKEIDVLIQCKEFLEEHYMDEITLEQTAERYHFNASYFSTIFKKYYGKTFMNFLIEIRMNCAKGILSTENCKIKEIAKRSGYTDSNYFIRAFKKYTGYTPEDYRRNNFSNSQST